MWEKALVGNSGTQEEINGKEEEVSFFYWTRFYRKWK